MPATYNTIGIVGGDSIICHLKECKSVFKVLLTLHKFLIQKTHYDMLRCSI